MTNQERDKIIAQLLQEGHSLSEVQRILETEHDEKMTYMDLRLIASGLEVNWDKLDDQQKAETIEDITKEPTEPAGNPAGGKTQVNVSKLVRPGAVLSGDVTFKSGATADWAVDQFGRLSLNPTQGSAKPNEEDLQEFQAELQSVLQRGGA